ncbi:MAG: MarR family transcriptional regulator [Lachnospiraceae bacterium]|nr:MarR family transcriptional regulator [Lachnospiraceae bacterium]
MKHLPSVGKKSRKAVCKITGKGMKPLMETKYPLGYQFKLIQEKFKKYFNASLESMDLTFSQFVVLDYLEKNREGKVTQKDISQALQLKHSTVIGILKRLEVKEMVQCIVDQENKRYRNVLLTKKAVNSLEEMYRHREEMEKRLVSNLTKEEEKELRILLSKVLYSFPQEE